MGERGQIKIGGVYLYTHWTGYALKSILQDAISKRWRWDDEEYLARIIFEAMVGNKRGTETGYGIGTVEHSDLNYPLLKVYVKRQLITEDEVSWSFEAFITLNFRGE